MTVGGRKHHRCLLMRATEQADFVGLRPDHSMHNPHAIVGSSLQISPPPFLRQLSACHSRFRRCHSFFTSGTHLVTKILHLSAHRYPRKTCRISKSLCQDAMHSVDTTPWYSRKMYCIFCHCSMTFQIIRGSNQCDIVRAVPSHLQYPTIWDGQRNDFNRQSRTK